MGRPHGAPSGERPAEVIQAPEADEAPADRALSKSTQDGSDAEKAPWAPKLAERLGAIAREFPGDIGVYVKHLEEGVEVQENADRSWYLASTVKVPVAIAALEKVESGELSLTQPVVLEESDFVDGAGDLKKARPGQSFTVAALLEASIRHSDSIATDLLIRITGVDTLNQRLGEWTGGGFGEITSLQRVRYDVYGALDPRVAELPPRTFLEVRAAGDGTARLAYLGGVLGVPLEALPVRDLTALFERYYAHGKNTARLDRFGRLLERLVRGELLEAESTERLLGHMQHITTGSRRIAAGLPPGVPFAQKTGTQVARSCNVGVIHPTEPTRQVVVVACAARYERLEQAEAAFQAVGSALTELVLLRPASSGPAISSPASSRPTPSGPVRSRAAVAP